MAGISYLTTSAKAASTPSLRIPTDESIGAMLFDISGFKDPFSGYPALYNVFKDNTVQCIKNMDDASLLGILDNGFLNGMFYYHIKQFYDMIGGNQALYICLADCKDNWDVIQNVQSQVTGKLFHIGVWTHQPIWQMNTDGTMGFTPLISKLQAQADEINGKVGTSTYKMTPLSIVLCGNSNYVDGKDIDYKKLPNAKILKCPKVSVVLAQNGSEEIHKIQEGNPLKAPVSAFGFLMACLAMCGAEESIASVKKCDLNQKESFRFPEWGFGPNYTPINKVNRIQANLASSKGYIIPMDYEALEASYFFSSDQTLCEGVFDNIANNRVMHKCRRAACTALLPYINSDQVYDASTKNISSTAISLITDSITTILDSVMMNKNGNKQIEGRTVEFQPNEDMLKNDTIYMKLSVIAVNSNEILSEVVSHDFD